MGETLEVKYFFQKAFPLKSEIAESIMTVSSLSQISMKEGLSLISFFQQSFMREARELGHSVGMIGLSPSNATALMKGLTSVWFGKGDSVVKSSQRTIPKL